MSDEHREGQKDPLTMDTQYIIDTFLGLEELLKPNEDKYGYIFLSLMPTEDPMIIKTNLGSDTAKIVFKKFISGTEEEASVSIVPCMEIHPEASGATLEGQQIPEDIKKMTDIIINRSKTKSSIPVYTTLLLVLFEEELDDSKFFLSANYTSEGVLDHFLNTANEYFSTEKIEDITNLSALH